MQEYGGKIIQEGRVECLEVDQVLHALKKTTYFIINTSFLHKQGAL